MTGFAFWDLTTEHKKTKQIPFTIISKGDNLYFYHSLCKAVFSVYTHKAELAFSAVRSPFVCFFLMADEMKTKGSEWETNIKHDISTHILNHSSDTRTSLRSFRLFFLSLSQMWVFSLSLSVSLGLTGFTALPSPPPALSLIGRVRAGRGLLSLLRRPDSAMSTPLSSLSVCPLSESWDRVDPAAQTRTRQSFCTTR